MKNSYSVSALIGVFCGQIRIRLRLSRAVPFALIPKPFTIRQLRWIDADYKNNSKISVV